MQRLRFSGVVFLFMFCLIAGISAQAQASEEPETVLVTYRPKAGQEMQLLGVLKSHWAAVTKLKLVDSEPHLLARGKDDAGRTIFVEAFTWVSAETPDHVAQQVQAIWTRMGELVEKREGHPGVDFRTVT